MSRLLFPVVVCAVLAGCGSGSSDAGSPAQAGGAGSDGGAAGNPAADGTTSLTGTLGDLGPASPTATSLVISNSGETLIYMSSAPITCDMLKTSRWLGSVDATAQVVEIVFKSAAKVGALTVGPPDDAEVNYAKGGRSSAYEKTASSGTVTLTTYTPQGPVEGTVEAKYANPAGSISGHFYAEFCDGGQGY